MARAPQRSSEPARAPQRFRRDGTPRPPPGFILHEDQDKFALPQEALDYQREHGIVYQWKRLTYAGKVDHQYQSALAMNRWLPVPLDRHPEMGSDGSPEDNRPNGRFGLRGSQSTPYADCVIRLGQILMERPQEIEDYVRDVEKEKADSQITNQIARVRMAAEGTLAGVNRERIVRVSRGRDLGVPEDAE
jgi:hypothetical protein